MVFRTLHYITNIQNFYDVKGSMRKCLPHLATRNEDVAREVLGFLCIMLFNANIHVQVQTVASREDHLRTQATTRTQTSLRICARNNVITVCM